MQLQTTPYLTSKLRQADIFQESLQSGGVAGIFAARGWQALEALRHSQLFNSLGNESAHHVQWYTRLCANYAA
jgi:hypothetical protein